MALGPDLLLLLKITAPPPQQCGCTYIVLVSTLYMLTILINIFLTSWWNSWVSKVGGRGDRKGLWWILTSIHALQSNSENCVHLKYAWNVYYVMASRERDLQPQKWHKTDVFQSKYLLSVCISNHIQYLVWGILGNKNPTNAYSHSSEVSQFTIPWATFRHPVIWLSEDPGKVIDNKFKCLLSLESAGNTEIFPCSFPNKFAVD